MSVSSRDRKQYLGVEYVIWNRENAWFWLLLNPHGAGGTAGAAPNSAGAMEDACSSIEAMLAISQD
ncbi:MAG TPA: hypothetical protein VJ728_01245 [Candidatus Binataceae bacterium]|nr:hypothetical protein [Candidatus Binataceae bacterium]